MTVDLTNGWDYWPVMGEQVDELRRRYNILPMEAFLPAGHQFAGTWPDRSSDGYAGPSAPCRLGGES
jgi:hypothetical protein